MHPSPAERFYLEHEYHQQQIWAGRQAEIAYLNAAVAAQIADRISATVQVAQQEGDRMHYNEQTFNIGSVQIKAGFDNRLTLVIPTEFGAAVSFVATLSNGGRESGGSHLWWSFLTSVDGQNWCVINTPGATPFFSAQANGAGSTRQHGPFGNRIAVRIGCKNSNLLNDDLWLHGI